KLRNEHQAGDHLRAQGTRDRSLDMRFFRPYMKPMKSGHNTRGEQSSEGTGVVAPDPLVLAALEADLLDKGRRIDAPSRQFQELWFALLQRSWRALAMVPGDAGGAPDGVA